MKTDSDLPSSDASTHSALDVLIQRPRAAHIALPTKMEGIVIGTLASLDETGAAYVNLDTYGLSGIAALSLVTLSAAQQGQAVALGFEAGDPLRPIVLGVLQHPISPEAATHNKVQTEHTEAQPHSNDTTDLHTAESQATELHIEQQGTRILIEAEQELELRCGEAVILLTADGHIQLRGGYITSHADASQRIRGGSVQIN